MSYYETPAWQKALIGVATAGILLGGGLLSSYRQVGSQEMGVVTRFGKVEYVVESGPHLIVPFIDSLETVDVFRRQKIEFGYRTNDGETENKGYWVGTDANSGDQQMIEEAQMLTGTGQIVWASFEIGYQIDTENFTDYIFNTANADQTLAYIARSAIRQAVADYSFDEVLGEMREEIADIIYEIISDKLESYDIGINLLDVRVQNTQAPAMKGRDSNVTVRQAYEDVQTAITDSTTITNNAEIEAQQIKGQARQDAENITREAHQTKAGRVSEAQADVAEFNQLLTQYAADPTGTMQRLYNEAMARIIAAAEDVTIVDGSIDNILQTLNLGGEQDE